MRTVAIRWILPVLLVLSIRAPLSLAGKAASIVESDLKGNSAQAADPSTAPPLPPIVEASLGGPAEFELFDLTAIFFESSGLVTVTGQVRNLSQAPASGHVMLHFRSATEQLLYSNEAEVNRGQPFAHGATACFEATVTVGTNEPVRKVSVAFVAH